MQKRPPLVILVFGHTRVRSLRYVLEGLRREGVLPLTQVWIDGHHEYQSLVTKVEACRKLDLEFPEAKFIKYGTRAGPCKLMTDALRAVVAEYTDIIVFEDDCYPAPGAISALLQKLDEVRDDAKIFSVYGDRFNIANEDAGVYCFQTWGWASTAEKLQLINFQLASFWNMNEPQYLQYVRERLTPELMVRLNEIPGRSRLELLYKRFGFDSSIDFILAVNDIKNKPTAQRCIWNFGQDADSGHFGSSSDKFKAPPFNMITEEELVEKFALPEQGLYGLRAVQLGQSYDFNHGGNGQVFLANNWSESENWGTWSCGDLCSLSMSADVGESEAIALNFDLKSFVNEKNPRMDVVVAVNGTHLTDWVFDLSSPTGQRSVTVPAKIWRNAEVNKLDFSIKTARSPSELGFSVDERKLGIGLVRMKIASASALSAKISIEKATELSGH